MFVRAFDLEAQASCEILFIADHHVHVFRDLLVDLLRALLAANGLPQRRTVVEVVGNNRAVLLGLLDALDDQLRGGVAERRKNTAGVQPTHAEFAEDVVPIEIAGLELRCRRVAAVGNAHRAAHTVAALGEIEAVTNDTANAVKRRPFDEVGIDTALQNEILDEPAHVVVGKCGGDGGLEAETATQSAGDVVFAASFPHFEFACAADTALARIKPEHDFSERDQVVLAGAGRFDVQSRHGQCIR